ncbi:hypothetical protein [Mammaliicoccus vitulinus]|uniref:hypothetical protein n=1 Tax=Mammaliicoccus vitulinus TaxID=71237 RepID=UPI00248BD2AB|nr:hypothetical protein [Mammaliicoccus vitulinus]
MNVFESVQEAFVWAFDERENFYELKREFDLDDEIESINDVIKALDDYTLESYLLDNSYVVRKENKYVFYHDELSLVLLK